MNRILYSFLILGLASLQNGLLGINAGSVALNLQPESDNSGFPGIPLKDLGIRQDVKTTKHQSDSSEKVEDGKFPAIPLDSIGIRIGKSSTVGTPGEDATKMSKVDYEVSSGSGKDDEDDYASSSIVAKFDCRREGHDCDFGKGYCNFETGRCVCQGGYSGYLCQNQASLIVDSGLCNGGIGCGDSPNAVCLKDEGGNFHRCSCPYHLYGEQCEKPRFELKCSATSIAISITPLGRPSFTGKVVALSLNDSSEIASKKCQFKTSKNVFELKVSTDDVVDACQGTYLEDEPNEYQLQLLVQSNSIWLTPFDQIIFAKCRYNITGTEIQKTVIAGVTSSTVDADGKEQRTSVSNDLVKLQRYDFSANVTALRQLQVPHNASLTLLRPNATGGGYGQLVGAVSVGDFIAFEVTNEDTSFYTSMRAENCFLTMGPANSLDLVERNCPASRLARSLVRWSSVTVTNSSIIYPLHLPVIAFQGKPREISITCYLRLCSDEAAEMCKTDKDGCSANQIRPSKTDASRRRRSVTDQFPSAFTRVSRSFEVFYDTVSSATRLPRPEFVVTFVFFLKFIF